MNNVKMRTLSKYPFLGAVIAGIPLETKNDLPTAATDGKKIFINPSFFNTLNVKQQVFLYAHEVLHIAFGHIVRSKDKDARLWNIATDAVINGLLKEDGLPMIKGGVEILGASSKTAEEVYAELLKETRENQNQNQGKGQNQDKDQSQGQSEDKKQSNQNNNAGHDSHELWKDAIKTKQDEMNAKAFTSIVERSISAGKTTSSVARAIQNALNQKPMLNWKYLLRQSLKNNIDWSYKNAEFENYILQPRLEKLPHYETEIVLDTSGSISDEILRLFLSEVKHILKTSTVKIGCVDTKFYGFETIKARDIENYKAIGGGGTDFDVAIKAFSKNAANKIFFTDGYANMPKEKANVIWVVLGNNEIEPKGGKVIHISEEQIRDMCFVNSKEEDSLSK